MNKCFLLCVFYTLLTCKNVNSYLSESWQWGWQCNNFGKCEKFSQPQDGSSYSDDKRFSNTSPESTSQNVCRLTCGKYGALWPIPTISTYISSKIIRFHPRDVSFQIPKTSNKVADFTKEIIKLFISNLEIECGDNCYIYPENTVAVSLIINSKNTSLSPNIDESYTLDISTIENQVQVKIQSETVFGARHALETLSQLIASYEIREETSRKSGLVMVAEAKIKDKPVFPYRGLLLDTARNFLTTDAMKRQIDAMAASKMNVLHWHATDSQSFPLDSRRVPQLARFGAYSYKHTYNASEIQHLIEYARFRGIRVIIEIDAPAHAGNGWQWGSSVGFGDLAVCVNKNPWRQYCIQPPCGQLNPVNDNLYTVLGDLYRDIVELYSPGEYFHMGGDEVFINCWNTTQEIVAYMENHFHGRNLDDFLQLWAQFQARALEMYDKAVGSSSTPIILWSSQLTNPDIIEKYLPKERYIIQTWVPSANELPHRLLEKGYRLIVSTKDAWYLDHGFWGNTQYHTWRIAYKNRLPRNKLVLGGEACMWGELVDDASLDGRIWPRTAAIAERLWSDPDTDTGASEIRFYRHRERLLSRGIDAEALSPGWCYQNEGECQ